MRSLILYFFNHHRHVYTAVNALVAMSCHLSMTILRVSELSVYTIQCSITQMPSRYHVHGLHTLYTDIHTDEL